MKEVKSQYNDWPYPEPIHDLKEKISEGFFYDLHLNRFKKIIFPEGKDYTSIDVLIAGCGTNQALYYALSYPEMNIFGIDLSKESIAHNQKMIKKYKIKNLKVEQKDIFDLKEKNKYDVIVATGVIHHTKNPKNTIIKLSEFGKDDCAIIIGIYSSYLRYGVYSLQNIFRLLNYNQTIEDLNLVKKFLNGIPDTHPSHRYINASDDLLTDAGVIDTFLHTQDVAFNTVELKDLIEESGLVFQSWFDNVYHYYTQYTLKNIKENQEYYDKIYKRIEGLDFWKQAEIAHNTNFSLGMFNFILRKDKNFEFMWHNINTINQKTIIEHRPFIRVVEKGNLSLNNGGVIERQISSTSKIKFNLNSKEGILWSSINDSESNKIMDILKRANEFCLSNKIDFEFNLEYAKEFFHKMWKNGFVIFGL